MSSEKRDFRKSNILNGTEIVGKSCDDSDLTFEGPIVKSGF